jgi:hypothetical protein
MSCILLNAQSTSQTQMKTIQKMSLWHLQQATLQWKRAVLPPPILVLLSHCLFSVDPDCNICNETSHDIQCICIHWFVLRRHWFIDMDAATPPPTPYALTCWFALQTLIYGYDWCRHDGNNCNETAPTLMYNRLLFMNWFMDMTDAVSTAPVLLMLLSFTVRKW